MRTGIGGDDQRDQREGKGEHPVRQALVQLAAEIFGRPLVARIVFIWRQKEAEAGIARRQRRFRILLFRHGRKVEGIGQELDDRHLAIRRLLLHFAVAHGQRCAALIDHAFLGIIDEIEIRIAAVGDEQALEDTALPLGDLHIKTVLNGAEGLFFDHRGQEVGVGRGHHLPGGVTRRRLDEIGDGEGKRAENGGQNENRAKHHRTRRSCRIDDGKLGIIVHRRECLGDADDEGERQNNGDQRRQDQGRERHEGAHRLTGIGDEIDSLENLDGPDDGQHRQQRDQKHLRCPPQDIVLEKLHTALFDIVFPCACPPDFRLSNRIVCNWLFRRAHKYVLHDDFSIACVFLWNKLSVS